MGREMRRVVVNWDHPQDDSGYIPLFEIRRRQADLKEYYSELKYFVRNGKKGEFPWYPDPKHYMPEGKWYQLFENTTEGTPLSPPFKKAEELIDWLVNNKDFYGKQWDREGAVYVVTGGYVPSMVVVGKKVYKAKDTYKVLRTK